MAKSWAWNPPKGMKVATKLKGDAAIPCAKYGRSVVPHVEQKTERAEACPAVQGPGNNVSALQCGVNTAPDKALGEIGRRALARFPKRMKERQRRKLERQAYLGR